MDTWLDPLRALDAQGDPVEEILAYARRKLEMSRDFPRESRLFANEIVQGAPRIGASLSTELKALVDDKARVIAGWSAAGRIAEVDPHHLIFSIWALTQHYARFRRAGTRGSRAGPRPPARGRGLSRQPVPPPASPPDRPCREPPAPPGRYPGKDKETS